MTANDTTAKIAPNPAPQSSWFRGFVQGKTRIVLAWAAGIALILSARQAPTLPGIILCFAGATLRFWASGFLRKDSRPAVGGPYAWIRNPLYLGTYLMAVGAAWSIENMTLLVSISVLFAVIYHFIILDEETKLQWIFGAPYKAYCELVPRFFPRPWPARSSDLSEVNPEASHHRFNYELALKNKAFEAYWSFLALIGVIWGFSWLWSKVLGK